MLARGILLSRFRDAVAGDFRRGSAAPSVVAQGPEVLVVGVVVVQGSATAPEVAVGLVRPLLRAVPGQPGVRRRREGAEWEVGAEEVEGAVDDERMEVKAGSCRTECG